MISFKNVLEYRNGYKLVKRSNATYFHFDEISNLGHGSCQDDPNDSDSDYEEVRSDLSSNVGILKWREVNLSLESDDSSVLSGVRRIRSDWNSLFEARLQPKRFKPKENDEILIKTLEEILIKEGKIRSFLISQNQTDEFFLSGFFFRGSHTTELHKQWLKRRVKVSRPRENQRKTLKKFSAYAIYGKSQKMGSNLFF